MFLLFCTSLLPPSSPREAAVVKTHEVQFRWALPTLASEIAYTHAVLATSLATGESEQAEGARSYNEQRLPPPSDSVIFSPSTLIWRCMASYVQQPAFPPTEHAQFPFRHVANVCVMRISSYH